MNIVILCGRMTREPTLKRKNTGSDYILFQIANHRSTNKVNYIPCIAFNGIAHFIDDYLGKGSLVGIEGTLESYWSGNLLKHHVVVKYLKVFIRKEQTDLILSKNIEDCINIDIIEDLEF